MNLPGQVVSSNGPIQTNQSIIHLPLPPPPPPPPAGQVAPFGAGSKAGRVTPSWVPSTHHHHNTHQLTTKSLIILFALSCSNVVADIGSSSLYRRVTH